MTIVSTMSTTKDERIYIRVGSEIKEDFERVAEYRGLTPSAILHSFIVRTIHEARQEAPHIFRTAEPKNQTLEKGDKVMTLDEAKADDKKKRGKKK